MKNPKIQLSFSHGILDVKYLDGAVIYTDDIKEIYAYGSAKAKGKKYGIMFEPLGMYEVTEEAVEYLSHNPNNPDILAKVYVLNSKEAETKTKFHFMFDKPVLKPVIFKTAEEGMEFLAEVLKRAFPGRHS